MPLASVTTTRGARSAGLEASTVTPGRTAFEESRTVPVMVACAKPIDGSSQTAAANTRHFVAPRMGLLLGSESVSAPAMHRGIEAFVRVACDRHVPIPLGDAECANPDGGGAWCQSRSGGLAG